MKKTGIAAAIIVFLNSTVSFAQMMPNGQPGMNTTNMGSGNGSSDAYKMTHEKMMQNMTSMMPTGNADKDFVMMMIPHHQGAIDMAQTELKFGKDPELRKMAQAVIAAQEKEIIEMKNWSAKNK